jgi:hypothetical protein
LKNNPEYGSVIAGIGKRDKKILDVRAALLQGKRIWKAKTCMFIFNRVKLGKATNVRVLQLFRKERGLARRVKDRRSAVPQRLEESL